MSRKSTITAGTAVAAGVVAVASALAPTLSAGASPAAPAAATAATVAAAPAASRPTPPPAVPLPGVRPITCLPNTTSPLRILPCLHTLRITSQVINQGNSFKIVFTHLAAGSVVTVSLDGVQETNNCPQTILGGSAPGPKGRDAALTTCRASSSTGSDSVILYTPTNARVKNTNITLKGFNGDGTAFYQQASIKIIPRTAKRP